MKPENFDIDELIESLQGTAQSLDEGIRKIWPEMEWEDLSQEDHEEIDNNIFLCEMCGWWCENSEMAEDEENVCDECKED